MDVRGRSPHCTGLERFWQGQIMEQFLRILNLEDDPLDSELASELLNSEGLTVSIDRVDTLAGFKEALERGSYALILSDYAVPGMDSMDALRLARRIRPEVPFIFLSGTLGEEQALETIKAGASDYVLKQRIARLAPAVRRAIQEAEERTRLKQTVEKRTLELREKSEHLEEVNAALKALLRQREEDRKEFEEAIAANVKHLIIPYIESLRKSRLSSAQKTWVEILETNLNEITSAFTRKLTLQYLNLSTAELRVAALVRDGKRTKEIAETLGISEKAVSFHRGNIRAKLGMRRDSGSLRNRLLNLT